jgi:hypothetical protein
LFFNSAYEVELEKDLSLKQQLLDVVIIEKKAGPLPAVLPEGLENLAAHNLMICKSHQESLDGWTIEEMCGHYAIGYLGKIHSQETQLEFLEWMLRYAYHAREDDLGGRLSDGNSKRYFRCC